MKELNLGEFPMNIRSRLGCVIACVFVSLISAAVQAQTNYSITWFSVDGGGGTSTGGIYSVSGTVGQPDAGGPMTGEAYSLVGGYWSVLAVQTLGAPRLRIRLVNPTTIAVSWPSPSTGFLLQETGELNTTNWTAVATLPVDDGTNETVTVSSPTGIKFYRLKRQD